MNCNCINSMITIYTTVWRNPSVINKRTISISHYSSSPLLLDNSSKAISFNSSKVVSLTYSSIDFIIPLCNFIIDQQFLLIWNGEFSLILLHHIYLGRGISATLFSYHCALPQSFRHQLEYYNHHQ